MASKRVEVPEFGTVYRQELLAWARRDPEILSARCTKAEEALYKARRLMLDAEGSLLAYWTDIPQGEVQRLTVALRHELGDFEPGKATP